MSTRGLDAAVRRDAIHEEGRTARRPESSRANADDLTCVARSDWTPQRHRRTSRRCRRASRASVPHSVDELTRWAGRRHSRGRRARERRSRVRSEGRQCIRCRPRSPGLTVRAGGSGRRSCVRGSV